MLAMQYSILLPDDYGGDRIRERVKKRSSLFDGHEGLVHKSYLYNDAEKLYAPFYIWQDATRARDFLLDDLFKGVIEAFRRHRVRSWFGVHLQHGAYTAQPAYACREVDVIAAEEKLDGFLAHEKHVQEKLAGHPDLYMHLVGIDADRWEILRFSLWKDRAAAPKPASDSFVEYEVLHVTAA